MRVLDELKAAAQQFSILGRGSVELIHADHGVEDPAEDLVLVVRPVPV